MATDALAGYKRWDAADRPYRLAKPPADLRDVLRGYGYTVYDYPDVRHQKAIPPEDHTAYSSTGWPQPATFGVGYAIDIMPPAAGTGLPNLAQLGAQIYADRQAGLPGIGWLKYMNWEPGDGSCHHDAWQPTHTRRDSSDRGHVHLSGRTDYTDSNIAAGYDPVARAKGTTDMYCKAGDKGSLNVETLQRRLVRLGGKKANGAAFTLADVDRTYGADTTAGLKSVIGGPGTNFGPLEIEALDYLYATRFGPAGPPGPAGTPGSPGAPGAPGENAVLTPGTVLVIQ